MRKLIIVIIAVILSVILFFILKKDEQKLGNNYYYLPNYEAMDVGYPGGGIIYKSPQKDLIREVKVKGDVVDAKSNRDFIIAIQNTDTSYVEPMKADISETKSLKYFIIEKRTDKVHGPYTKKAFQEMKSKLGVPKSLTLKDNQY